MKYLILILLLCSCGPPPKPCYKEPKFKPGDVVYVITAPHVKYMVMEIHDWGNCDYRYETKNPGDREWFREFEIEKVKEDEHVQDY